MARYIDADWLLSPRRMKLYYHLKNGDTAIPIIDIQHAPSADVVSNALFEQIKWERDIAIEQLNDLGIGLGEKIIKCKDCIHRDEEDCPMRYEEEIEWDDDGYIERNTVVHDYTKDEGWCYMGERRTDGEIH